jgi:hypothetical protein
MIAPWLAAASLQNQYRHLPRRHRHVRSAWCPLPLPRQLQEIKSKTKAHTRGKQTRTFQRARSVGQPQCLDVRARTSGVAQCFNDAQLINKPTHRVQLLRPFAILAHDQREILGLGAQQLSEHHAA